MAGVVGASGLDRGPTLSRELVDDVLTNTAVQVFLGRRQVWTTPYRLRPRILNHYDCIYVLRGGMVWTVGQRRCPVGESDLLLVPPSIRHGARSTRVPLAFVSLHVWVGLPGGQDLLALFDVPSVQQVRPDSRLTRYLSEAATEWDRDQGDPMINLVMSSWARLIMLELLREDADRGLLSPRPLDPRIRLALDVIGRSLPRPRVTATALAAQVGVSPQHLNRLFRQALGVTALEYLGRLRMSRATTLLDQTDLTVRAIGRRVGYEDPYHFSRVFSQHHGLSPARWRDRQRAPTGAHRDAFAVPRGETGRDSEYPSCP